MNHVLFHVFNSWAFMYIQVYTHKHVPAGLCGYCSGYTLYISKYCKVEN